MKILPGCLFCLNDKWLCYFFFGFLVDWMKIAIINIRNGRGSSWLVATLRSSWTTSGFTPSVRQDGSTQGDCGCQLVSRPPLSTEIWQYANSDGKRQMYTEHKTDRYQSSPSLGTRATDPLHFISDSYLSFDYIIKKNSLEN